MFVSCGLDMVSRGKQQMLTGGEGAFPQCFCTSSPSLAFSHEQDLSTESSLFSQRPRRGSSGLALTGPCSAATQKYICAPFSTTFPQRCFPPSQLPFRQHTKKGLLREPFHATALSAPTPITFRDHKVLIENPSATPVIAALCAPMPIS